MPCYHPIPALRERVGGRVVLHPPGVDNANLCLPCGVCVGCKVSRGQEWASRCMHELREHHSAVFATLTYRDEFLPDGGNLAPADLQLFLKRLRAVVSRSEFWRGVVANPPGSFYAGRLRYVACGEYGDIGKRPHYHAILFGVSFGDACRVTPELWSSPVLDELWGYGNVRFGEVTRASCAYVAGYTAKSFGRAHHDEDGCPLEPPFLRVSRGIGRRYVERYAEDFRSGALVVDGTDYKIPRFYKKVLASKYPLVMQDVEYALDKRDYGDGAEPDRLVAGEVIALRKRELTRSHSL